MFPVSYQRERRRLAERLKRLRESAVVSGSQLARRHGWVQPRVSRIETGKQLPTETDIDAWVAVAGSTAETRDELVAMLGRARTEYADWQEAFRASGGAAQAQSNIGSREAETTRLRTFQPAMIPGLLQTAAYAREALSIPGGPAAHGAESDDIADMVNRRMERQQILYEPGKTVEIILMEAALWSRLCSVETLAGQLDRLIAAAAAVDFKVVPVEARLPVFPLNGFTILDDELVIVETSSGEQQLSGEHDLTIHDRFWQLLRDLAATGRDASAVVQRALDQLTRETP